MGAAFKLSHAVLVLAKSTTSGVEIPGTVSLGSYVYVINSTYIARARDRHAM